jgi:superfamily II DNA or RNA helicase
VRFDENQNVLLIVDEAHNFGSPKMVEAIHNKWTNHFCGTWTWFREEN